MKDLHTLQECFEAMGSTFPFTVTFHHNLLHKSDKAQPVVLTFIKKCIAPGWGDNAWMHDQHDEQLGNPFTYHKGFDLEHAYSYKEHIFKKDLEKLLSLEDEEK